MTCGESVLRDPADSQPPTSASDVLRISAACQTWDDIAAACRGCIACPELVASRTKVVVGDAPSHARLVLVGEAPGSDEDTIGRPFVGRAGRLLDELLAEAGLPRPDVGVLNVVQCRPLRNRAPKPAEIENCRGWLRRKLEILHPELICTLGLTAARWFLGRNIRLAASRGKVHDTDGYRVVTTYHPAAAIRFGPAGLPRQALREDLALVARVLSQTCGNGESTFGGSQ